MPFSTLTLRPDLLPSLAILLGGALWGLFWVPVRALGDLGLGGACPAAVIFGGCLCLLLPVLPFRMRQLANSWRVVALGGLFTGTALAFYSISLLMTDVVHSLLLFYLTPVWSTALGIALLGERLTFSRLGALAFGAAGLAVVLGGGEGVPWPRNLGDWLALGAGMAWSFGSLRLYHVGTVAVPEQILAFTLGSLVVIFTAIAVGGALGAAGGAVRAANRVPDAVAGDAAEPRPRRHPAHERGCGRGCLRGGLHRRALRGSRGAGHGVDCRRRRARCAGASRGRSLAAAHAAVRNAAVTRAAPS